MMTIELRIGTARRRILRFIRKHYGGAKVGKIKKKQKNANHTYNLLPQKPINVKQIPGAGKKL
jgi:hypothetical protein